MNFSTFNFPIFQPVTSQTFKIFSQFSAVGSIEVDNGKEMNRYLIKNKKRRIKLDDKEKNEKGNEECWE